jgi:hypothetical protein
MQKLISIRNHLLQSPSLAIGEQNIQVFASNGVVVRAKGINSGGSFRIEYTAVIIINNFSKAEEILFFSLVDWIAKNIAGHSDKAFKFIAHKVNNHCTNFEVEIPLSDTVKATTDDNGNPALAPQGGLSIAALSASFAPAASGAVGVETVEGAFGDA